MKALSLGLPFALNARHAIAALALAGTATFLAPAPAQALIEYPYCMKVYTRDQYEDCSYSTLAQCQLSASGRSAMCYRDPFYRGAPGTPYVVREPRVPYSPFGNIDPYYDPYRVAPAPVPSRHIHRKPRNKTQHKTHRAP
jgi:hypothetical protein